MRTRFIANFQGTHDRPPAVSDMRRIKQQPGETLQKYIQRFNNTRFKIPKVTEEAIISAFSDGVRDVKMKEDVRTPTRCHIDLACNTSYHFAASRTVSPRVSPYLCLGPFAPFSSRI